MVVSKRANPDDSKGRSAAKASVDGTGATIGMLTSGIKNKIARSEAYAKLKKIKDVRIHCTCISHRHTLELNSLVLHVTLQFYLHPYQFEI